jgi:tetratricopeptide (TPR) repeat protein
MGVLAGILIIGLGAAAIVMRHLPQRDREIAAATSGNNAPDANGLPAGHPSIQMPKEALDFIAGLKRNADAAPNDVAAWDRLGDVTLRAALFDPKYYAESQTAYGHVLKLDPDNLDALRGIGNVNYDLHNYDQAIAAYEHYLKRKPDDPEVMTDLGTMYLSTGNAPEAVLTYKRALLAKPDFYQAWFNLGVAYDEENQAADARASFQKALALAPDDTTRKQTQQALAALGNAGPQVASGAGNAANASTFQGAVEQLARALPIAGPKVQTVNWPAADHAQLVMQNFPMDSMPPFVRTKFIGDLQSSVSDAMNAHHVAGPVTIDVIDAASGGVMQTVTVAGGGSSPAASAASDSSASAANSQQPPAAPEADGAVSSAPDASAPAPGAEAGGFHGAIANAIHAIPFAGDKVQSIEWPASDHARVMMINFPMDAMPPFARTKFIDDLKAGIQGAKSANQINAPVEVDIADAATGRVMESVTQ